MSRREHNRSMGPVTAREVATLAYARLGDEMSQLCMRHLAKVAEVLGRWVGPSHPAVGVAWLSGVFDVSLVTAQPGMEDEPLDAAWLRYYGIGDDQLAAIEALANREGETLAELQERVSQNPWARLVRRADLSVMVAELRGIDVEVARELIEEMGEERVVESSLQAAIDVLNAG